MIMGEPKLCLLAVLIIFTWTPSVDPERHQKMKIPEDLAFSKLSTSTGQNGIGNSSEVAEQCGCECDHYYEKMIQYLKYLKGLVKPKMLPLSMMSAGCDDPGFTEDCGASSIKVDGAEYSGQRRGHNVVVLNSDGSLWTSKSFDTWNFFSGEDGETMNEFLLSVPLGKIVLVAVQDSGDRHVEAATEGLASVNADTSKLSTEFRSSWLLVGYRGTRMPWVFQASNPRAEGPTVINTYIPLPSQFCAHSVSL